MPPRPPLLDVVVHSRVADAGLAGPGVDVGAGLAGAHVPHAGLVPQVAHLGVVAAPGTVLRAEAHTRQGYLSLQQGRMPCTKVFFFDFKNERKFSVACDKF